MHLFHTVDGTHSHSVTYEINLTVIIFFIGLVILQLAVLYLLGKWNDYIFNGIMLMISGYIGIEYGKKKKRAR